MPFLHLYMQHCKAAEQEYQNMVDQLLANSALNTIQNIEYTNRNIENNNYIKQQLNNTCRWQDCTPHQMTLIQSCMSYTIPDKQLHETFCNFMNNRYIANRFVRENDPICRFIIKFVSLVCLVSIVILVMALILKIWNDFF